MVFNKVFCLLQFVLWFYSALMRCIDFLLDLNTQQSMLSTNHWLYLAFVKGHKVNIVCCWQFLWILHMKGGYLWRSSIDFLKAAVGQVAFFFWLTGWFYGVLWCTFNNISVVSWQSFYWWRKPEYLGKTTDLSQVTLYHIMYA